MMHGPIYIRLIQFGLLKSRLKWTELIKTRWWKIMAWKWKWKNVIDYEGGAKNENKWKKLAEFGTDFI